MPKRPFSKLTDLLRPRPRKRDLRDGRALIGFDGVPLQSLPAFEAKVRELAAELPEIDWVEVNPFLRRVVFALRTEAAGAPRITTDVLEALVREAERKVPDFGETIPAGRELPDDELMRLQRFIELAADAAGLGFGLALRVVPFAPAMLGANAVFLLSVVQSQPRMRARLDERLGPERTDMLLNLCLSFCQGLSQRPVSSMVDIGYRLSVLRELRARSRAYERKRRDLTRHRGEPDLSPAAVSPVRPGEQPMGPLESYTQRMWIPASSAFGVSLLTTRSPTRAIMALFSALPKPARIGRDFFANEVGRTLGEQGTLVLEPDALKRLDRIDCLVLDGKLLTEARFRIGRVLGVGGVSDGEARQRVYALFDPRQPVEVQHSPGTERERLGPAALLDLELDGEARELSETLSDSGALVLTLARGDRALALAEVEIRKGLGVEELLHTAEQGGLRVLIASDADEGLAHLGHDHETLPAGEDLVASLRRLQHKGHAVCFVSDGHSPALPQADCSVGIHREGEPPPWGAHIMCGQDLEELRTLLRACLLSRGVSKQSVNLAMGATAVGTLVSAGAADRTSRRVMFVVNVASVVSMINALRQSAPLHPGTPEALPDPTPWHALEARGVLARLGSSEQGLAQQGAIERRREQTPEPTALAELAQAVSDELFNPLAPLLAAGAGLSAMVGSTLDAGIVAGVGGINALVSGVQRFRTEREIRRLVHPVELHVKAVRDGRTRMLRSSDLVVGDVIELSAGELVPADCRLIDAHNLEVDSSSLTGESLPSPKDTAPSFDPSIADRSCMLYAGTEVVSGTARAVVVGTGAQVEAQRGAHIAEQSHPQSGVEARLRELMQLTGPVAAAGGLAVMAAGMVRGRRTQDLVASGVSMAVAAIPEGLPVLASAAQLSTARRLSREGALVRNARCIEALGRVDVICLDKTGTLTEGAIELHLVSDGELDLLPEELGPSTRIVLEAALRASTGRDVGREHHDPTDAALLRAAAVLDVDPDAGETGWHPRSEHPFESRRGYHAVVGRTDKGLLASVKGAPEKVIERCAFRATADGRAALDEEGQVRLVTHAARLAAEGLRVLAVAERTTLLDGPDAEGDGALDATDLRELCFLGFLGFRDPPREAAARTIEKLRQAGIEVVMLTGDHVNTARSIAEDVDMLRGRTTMTGGDVARLDDDELQKQATEAGVFARVTPAQKVRIVRALQANGRVVAMVGDGANDAPALRAAEVGVAVGERSAEAARAAADIVFAETGIETLCDGVVEARAMWLSVRDAVSILVGGNLGEIGFTVVGGLLSGRPPLNPRQILLVNFLTDVAPAMAVALRRPSQDIYDQLTEGRPEEAFQSGLDREIAIRAVSTTLGATWAWGLGRLTGTKSRASTMALAALVGTQLGQTMLYRGDGTRVTWTSLGSWAALATIVQTPGLSQLFGCRPIGPVAWTIALGSSAAATGTSVALSRAERYFSTWLDQVMGRDSVPPVAVRVTVRDADGEQPPARPVLEMPDLEGLDLDA